jgi:hypothetical protein
MRKVIAIAVAAMMIMAGMLIWHEYNSPQLPKYNLNIGLNDTYIQNVTINNYAYHNIHSDWFNVTMAGYVNYTILFPYYVAYDGHTNNTAQVYLAHNTTVLFNFPNTTLRITTLDPNASLTFQQMIHLNRTTSPFINKAFSNIAFFYNNGTPIYAWLESITNNNATLWLKLNGSINRTINIKVYGQTANEMNSKGHYGEAPQLSATYGQYDNGANVFNFYDNFAGMTIGSQYAAVLPSGTTITQNNGITIATDVSSLYGGLITVNNFSTDSIFEGDVTLVSGVASGFSLQTGNSSSDYGYVFSYWSGSVTSMNMLSGSEGGHVLNPDLQISTGIMGGAWLSSTSQTWYKNYIPTFGTQTQLTLPSAIYLSFGIYYSSPSSSITFQWLRVRAYPPNGVMPSSSSNFGPIYIGG